VDEWTASVKKKRGLSGTAPEYRDWCDRVAAGGFRELKLA
jgi:hypothetical protein